MKAKRPPLEPSEYGIDMSRQALRDVLCTAFDARFRKRTIEDVLMHPKEAIEFCDAVREQYEFVILPDDVILRSIMQRRKAGKKFSGRYW